MREKNLERVAVATADPLQKCLWTGALQRVGIEVVAVQTGKELYGLGEGFGLFGGVVLDLGLPPLGREPPQEELVNRSFCPHLLLARLCFLAPHTVRIGICTDAADKAPTSPGWLAGFLHWLPRGGCAEEFVQELLSQRRQRIATLRAGKTEAACTFLYGEEGVLLQARDNRPGISSPGTCALPGGRVHPDELPEEAAARELKEEADYYPTTLHKVGTIPSFRAADGKLVRIHIYVSRYDSAQPIRHLGEGRWIRMVPWREVPTLNLAPVHRDWILRLCQDLRSAA